ncbi:PaaI family thioesterase [Anianabacter salinae]|uniref:PaaI family thioesterase n=1 Tax=Anianabacter salinae TaxID=2851023 RepID=UPI00225E5772|nr:PaaI family thioesterase [Anianabacter salinae]MBV0914060.1 PaaI family thioesterase [Anianabacter salinae]
MTEIPPNLHPVPADLVEPEYPAQSLIGFQLTGWGDGYARFEMDLGPQHMNRHGNPHGGIAAALLDSAMGFTGAFTGARDDIRHTMSLSITVNYLAPPEGPRLVAEGHRTGGGRKVYFTEGRMWDGAGRLCATATGTFKARD